MLLAAWGCGSLSRCSPLQIPRLQTAQVDRRGALPSRSAASIAAGAAERAWLPAFQLSRANLGDALKDGERGGSRRRRCTHPTAAGGRRDGDLADAAGRRRACWCDSLIVLQHVDPGFRVERALSMQLQLARRALPDAAIDARLLSPLA